MKGQHLLTQANKREPPDVDRQAFARDVQPSNDPQNVTRRLLLLPGVPSSDWVPELSLGSMLDLEARMGGEHAFVPNK